MKVRDLLRGDGVRMGEETQRIPKPMIRIGNRPICGTSCATTRPGVTRSSSVPRLQGRCDQGVLPRRTTRRCSTTSSPGLRGRDGLEILNRDARSWRITFADTGTRSTIGERLKLVEPYLGDDEVFLATYGDGLPSCARLVRAFEARGSWSRSRSSGRISTPISSTRMPTGRSRSRSDGHSGVRINGGFFVMRREVLDWIQPGDEFVEETFEQLIVAGGRRFVHEGFFGPMDTIKDRQWLEGLLESGRAPWLAGGCRGRTSPVVLMRSFDGFAPSHSAACSRSALTRTTSRSAPGRERFSRDPRLAQSSKVDWVVLVGPGNRAGEARVSAAAFLEVARQPHDRRPPLPRRLPPAHRGGGEGCFEA